MFFLAEEYDIDEQVNAAFTRDPLAYRGLFLIDKEGKVRHQVIKDLPLGRTVDETLRMVNALHYFEVHGEVCPANRKGDEDALKADAEGVSNYLSHHYKIS